jgi:hypothetical protein
VLFFSLLQFGVSKIFIAGLKIGRYAQLKLLAVNRAIDFPVVNALIEKHIGLCERRCLFGSGSQAYHRYTSGYLPLTDSSAEVEESDGQNLMKLVRWGFCCVLFLTWSFSAADASAIRP